MENKDKLISEPQIIAAAITLLLGIILAIGYPTGGVKAKRNNYVLQSSIKRMIINRNLTKKSESNELTKKKKKIIKHYYQPPINNNDSQDEGC